MKIRVAMLTGDTVYAERLSAGFNNRYFEKVEVACFTGLDSAKAFFGKSAVHVFLVEDGITLMPGDAPDNCAVAYLSHTKPVGSGDGIARIAKYQRLETMYKAILGLYDEKFGGDGISVGGDRSTRIITFASPAGGCGSSTAAAAFAVRAAGRGSPVLYLNCEVFGSEDQFFSSGESGLPELLFAIKSKKGAGIDVKLESMVSRTPEGVSTLRAFQSPVDLFSVGAEDITLFVTKLRESGMYDIVVFDTSMIPNDVLMSLLWASDTVVCTLDGSGRANEKMRRAFEYFRQVEDKTGKPLVEKIRVLYNRVIRGAQYGNDEWKTLGTIPRLEGNAPQKLKHISGEKAFEGLLKG